MNGVTTILIHPGSLYSEGLSRILSSTTFNVNYVLSSPDGVPPELVSDPGLLFIIGGKNSTGLASYTQVIAQRFRLARIVVIGDHIDTEGVFLALEAGARGYLTDNISSEALVKSLELIMLDEAVLPGKFAAVLQNTWLMVTSWPLGMERRLPKQMINGTRRYRAGSRRS